MYHLCVLEISKQPFEASQSVSSSAVLVIGDTLIPLQSFKISVGALQELHATPPLLISHCGPRDFSGQLLADETSLSWTVSNIQRLSHKFPLIRML